MKKEMDFKHFKKTAEDHKSATLRHPDGHEIRVAKGAISPSLRDQLSKLKFANGGEEKLDHKDESILALTKALARRGQDNDPKGVHEATSRDPKGGKSVAGEYAQFGKPGSLMDGRPEAKRIHERKLKELKGMKKPELMAGGGVGGDQQGLADVPVEESPQFAAPQDRQPAQASPSPRPQTLMGQINAPVQGLPMPAPDPDKAKYLQQDQAWAQDLANGHIQPKTYNSLFQEKSTLGKVGHIFGLMVGSAGAGLAHQDNAFIGMMDKQIKNDLEAQMKSKENAQNYIKLNQAQILAESGAKLSSAQALNIAIPLANMQMNRAVLHDLVTKMNSFPVGSPQRAAYQQKLLGVSQQVMDKNNNLADQAEAMGAMLGNGDESQPMQQPQVMGANQTQGQNPGGLMDQGNAAVPPQKPTPVYDSLFPKEQKPVHSVLMPNALKQSVLLNKLDLVDKAKLQSQLTQADQAEKVLNGPKGDGVGGIDDLMDEMYKDVSKGGSGLETRMKKNIGGMPYIGHIGEEGMNMVYQGEGYKDYTSKQQSLKTDLASALSGLISVNDLDKIVDANSPDMSDSQEDIDRKKEAIINTVKKALKTDELKKWHLLHKSMSR